MFSKSWPTVTAAHAVSSGNDLAAEGHTGFFKIEDRKPDGRYKSSKRKDCAEKRLDKASKKSRDSESPTPGPSNGFQYKTAFTKKSGKRKYVSNDTQGPLNKKRKTSSSTEKSRYSVYKTGVPLPSTYNSHRLEDFESKYEAMDVLGKGSYGTVCLGVRKEDSVQVVIKCVYQDRVDRTPMLLNGKMTNVPLEVALLIRVGAGPEAVSSNVTPVLLEWFDLESELIMVFEGQKRLMDLSVYLKVRNRFLCESEVKNIMRKLVDAAIEMLSRGVFHQDIKANNIVIESTADLSKCPQVKYIDFGYGTTFTPEVVTRTRRPVTTLDFDECNANIADCITVYQLGTLMDRLLHYICIDTAAKSRFSARSDISDNCKDFLAGSLNHVNKDRLTLKELKNHPWLN